MTSSLGVYLPFQNRHLDFRAAFSTGTALLELKPLSPESSESGGVGNDRAAE